MPVSCGDENALKLTVVKVVQFCEYVKTHKLIYFKVWGLRYELYLNGAVKKKWSLLYKQVNILFPPYIAQAERTHYLSGGLCFWQHVSLS